MKMSTRYSICILGALLAANPVLAGETGLRKDSKALEVMAAMSAYTRSLDRVVIEGVSLTDARLEGGLMVSNATEVKITIDRPASLHTSSFDGHDKKELYFHDGTLTVFRSESGFYGQAEIPDDIEAALDFALEELDIEAPLMDMIYSDASTHLLDADVAVLYLTDKARIGGADCHHVAIRGPEIDAQLWVQEGDRPVPRKIVITSKWEGGSPRFIANMKWDSDPDFGEEVFEFKAPEGAMNIGFADRVKSEGE